MRTVYQEKRSKIPHHYAGILLVTNTGRLVGQRRDDKPDIDNPGKIATFGGTVEVGESYRYAAWRELVTEETNLKASESGLELFFEDTSWRPLTSEWEARHFYKLLITEEQLSTMEVYEGQGWAEIKGPDDSRLVDAWRVVIKEYLDNT